MRKESGKQHSSTRTAPSGRRGKGKFLLELVIGPAVIRGRNRLCVICGLIGAAAFLAQFSSSGQNLILNGDFEHNSAGTNLYNLNNVVFNSVVPNATAFGTGNEIDLMNTDDTYGPLPQSGLWKAGIHKSGYPEYGNNDAFSFTLSAPVVAGQQYTLSFYAQDVLTSTAPGNGAVQIGISGSATAFGTLVFSGTPSTADWTHLVSTFTAPVGGLYLTVQVDPDAIPTWANIDNFSLTVVPEPGSLTLLSGLGLAALLVRKGRGTLKALKTLNR